MTLSSFKRSSLRILSSIISLLLLLVVASAGEDLYTILGIPRTATTKDIKSAYRKKARDTHPDKNVNVNKEEANEAFRRVVHAFETLSDAASRRRYDQTGRHDGAESNRGRGGGSNSNNGFHPFHWHFQQRSRRPVRLKDKPEVKQAQSRVLHVVR
jgi:DnaJ-class molecular chaperone